MKKFLLVGTFFLLLSFSSSVLAITQPQGKGQEIRQKIATGVTEFRSEIHKTIEELKIQRGQLNQQRKIELRERQATKRAEIATKVAQLRGKVIGQIKEVFATILDRMKAALQRLDKIVNRINSRIAKLKERGVDTTRAEQTLVGCSDEQAAAENAIKGAKAKVGEIDPSSTKVREAVILANSQVRAAKRSLQNYHKCLVNVLTMLKASGKEATVSAQ